MPAERLCFDPIHIDIARNSTDDFNPFHDPQRWDGIRDNPFGAPIALGFQMEFLAADRVAARRRLEQQPSADTGPSGFLNYEFQFANVLRAGEPFSVDVRKTTVTRDGRGRTNRVVLRKETGDLVLSGSISSTDTPRFLADAQIHGHPPLENLPDRKPVPGTPYFGKRKFLNTANGKNFALGALCAQQDYFDELREQIAFPPMFTAALMSSALLEKGWFEGYDFAADPLVYTHHQISIDQGLQRRLRSNDRLHFLIEGPLPTRPTRGLNGAMVEQQAYHCFGLLHGHDVLLRAVVTLAPLHAFGGRSAR